MFVHQELQIGPRNRTLRLYLTQAKYTEYLDM